MKDEDKLEQITFTDDNGEEVTLFVVDETKIAGVTYLLLTEDPDSEEVEAYIFKLVGEEGEEQTYEPVEDDKELEYIGRVFEEQMADDEE